MLKKGDINDEVVSMSRTDVLFDIARFVQSLDDNTKAKWMELQDVAKNLQGPGFAKKKDVMSIYSWATKNIGVEPKCVTLIKKYKPGG